MSGDVCVGDVDWVFFEKERKMFVQFILFFEIVVLCNNLVVIKVDVVGFYMVIGEFIEIVLQVFVMRFDFGKFQFMVGGSYGLLVEYFFDLLCKRMMVVCCVDGLDDVDSVFVYVYIKGVIEVILFLMNVLDVFKVEIVIRVEVLVVLGFCVFCVVWKFVDVLFFFVEFKEGLEQSNNGFFERNMVECDFVFLGLVGFYDFFCVELVVVVVKCKEVGIMVYMFIGDYVKIVIVIVYEIGILFWDFFVVVLFFNSIMVVSVFDVLIEVEIDVMFFLFLVFVRCSFIIKVRMVEVMYCCKVFCVMIGDGVNDFFVFKISDVGIVMGLNGSDVVKEVVDMVFIDDNFVSIVIVVEEGCCFFDNI